MDFYKSLHVILRVCIAVFECFVLYLTCPIVTSLDNWERSFIICAITRAVCNILLVVFVKFDKEDDEKSSEKSIGGCVYTFSFAMMIWTFIVWIHTNSSDVKFIAMVVGIRDIVMLSITPVVVCIAIFGTCGIACCCGEKKPKKNQVAPLAEVVVEKK